MEKWIEEARRIESEKANELIESYEALKKEYYDRIVAYAEQVADTICLEIGQSMLNNENKDIIQGYIKINSKLSCKLPDKCWLAAREIKEKYKIFVTSESAGEANKFYWDINFIKPRHSKRFIKSIDYYTLVPETFELFWSTLTNKLNHLGVTFDLFVQISDPVRGEKPKRKTVYKKARKYITLGCSYNNKGSIEHSLCVKYKYNSSLFHDL